MCKWRAGETQEHTGILLPFICISTDPDGSVISWSLLSSLHSHWFCLLLLILSQNAFRKQSPISTALLTKPVKMESNVTKGLYSPSASPQGYRAASQTLVSLPSSFSSSVRQGPSASSYREAWLPGEPPL